MWHHRPDERNGWGDVLYAVCAVLLLALILWTVAGCSTVHQDAVEPGSAGFYVPPKAVPGGFVVDAAFRDRYNALIAVYGRKKLDNGAPVFVPPLSKDDGVLDLGDKTWFMSKDAMQNMILLSDMKRRGSAP